MSLKAELVRDFSALRSLQRRERVSQVGGDIPSSEGTEVFLGTLGAVLPSAVALGASVIIAGTTASPRSPNRGWQLYHKRSSHNAPYKW